MVYQHRMDDSVTLDQLDEVLLKHQSYRLEIIILYARVEERVYQNEAEMLVLVKTSVISALEHVMGEMGMLV